VLISAEWDHPDVFESEDAVVRTFADWIGRLRPGPDGPPTLVANAGDTGVHRVLDALGDWEGRRILVRLVAGGADQATPVGDATLVGRVLGEDRDGTDLEIAGLRGPEASPDRARIPLIGRHMAVDALMAAGGALAAGVDPDAILAGLSSFEGVGRRFELKGEVAGVTVLDDYAHHPTAMHLTFGAARQRYPGRRLWAVYEPLTYHRTAAMLDRFAEVLAEADRAAVIDIWAVRDPDTTITSAATLAEATSARSRVPAIATGSPEATAVYLAGAGEPGDVVVVMGGGRSYVAAEQLVERMLQRERAGGLAG
jgi:UDP-N-acetylmuramate--alanine ligase